MTGEPLTRDGQLPVGWADHGWAELFGTRVLYDALTFAWPMVADPSDISASARSADGAPLMERGEMPDAAGPTGDPPVRSWKTWSTERGERGASDAAPMTREEWAAEFLDANGDLIPAPVNGELIKRLFRN